MSSSYANLLPANGKWKQLITDYLQEDVPSFDFGAFVVGNKQETASLYMKQAGLIWEYHLQQKSLSNVNWKLNGFIRKANSSLRK